MRSLAAVLLPATALAATEPRFSDVFVGGRDGYPVYRIPAVAVARDGTLLAFAEGRRALKDQAQNDIVLKRSNDGGATWSALHVLYDDGANSLNNPTVLAAGSGRVFLLFQRIPSHLTEHSADNIATGFDGPDVYRTLLMTSDDHGATWSAPQDVTRMTKRPARATTVASGPGIGIELTRGPHRGRFIVPFNEGPYGRWQNYAAFSDDGGKTWTCGEDVPGALVADGTGGERSQINEVQVAELEDGSVLLDSRQFAGAKVRRASISHDGGKSWSPVVERSDLTDPSCMASTFRFSFADAGRPGLLLHSGPDSTRRENGTIWLSRDDGASWPVKRVLWPGPFAYSILTRLPDGDVGCLFEADTYKAIRFARFPVAWLSAER